MVMSDQGAVLATPREYDVFHFFPRPRIELQLVVWELTIHKVMAMPICEHTSRGPDCAWWMGAHVNDRFTETEGDFIRNKSAFWTCFHVCLISREVAFDAVRAWFRTRFTYDMARGEEALRIGHIMIKRADGDRAPGLLLHFRRKWRLYARLE